jgi:phage terminase small subunit
LAATFGRIFGAALPEEFRDFIRHGMGKPLRKQNILIITPTLDECGPAMQALSDMQRRFVLAVLAQVARGVSWRKLNTSLAAREAGYATKSAALSAVNQMRSPKVVRALHEEAGRRLQTLSLSAVMTLEHNLSKGNAKARQNAADSILDRTGFPRRMEKSVEVEHKPHKAHEQLLALVYEKLKGHSISVEKLKELPAPVDAQFKEVEDVAQADAVAKTEDE